MDVYSVFFYWKHICYTYYNAQSANFGFLDIERKNYIIIDHSLSIFKYYINISRNQHKRN